MNALLGNKMADRNPGSSAPGVILAELNALSAGLEHGAATGEVDPGLHDHADRPDVAFDPCAGPELDRPQRAHVSEHPSLDQRLLHLDVRAHDPMLTDLEALAVEDVAFQLTLDAQRARHHHRAAEARADANHGVRGLDDLRLIGAAIEEFHRAPFP